MVIVKLFDTVTRAVEEEFRTIGRPEFYSYFGSPEDFIAHRPDLKLDKLRPPRELVWHLDTVSLQNIELASANMDLLIRQVDLKVLEFPHYGKEFMKRYVHVVLSPVEYLQTYTWFFTDRYRLIPDFYVQMVSCHHCRFRFRGTSILCLLHSTMYSSGNSIGVLSSSWRSSVYLRIGSHTVLLPWQD